MNKDVNRINGNKLNQIYKRKLQIKPIETKSLLCLGKMTSILDISFNTLLSHVVYTETEKSQRARSRRATHRHVLIFADGCTEIQ